MIYDADFLIKQRKKLWEKNNNLEEDYKYRCAAADQIINDPDLRYQITKNPEKFIELEFIITDKKKNVVPFFLNEVQTDFIIRLNKALKDHEEGRLNKIIFLILKGRQQGFTSLITAYQLACAILNRNFEGYTLADVDANVQTIFENKAKFPYSKLPEALKPTEKFNNRKELKFNILNSSWTVAAATKKVGRSRTINFFHGSEVAFWEVSLEHIQAAMQPAFTKDCIAIYETTANGFNDFKDLWDSKAHINCFYEWWKTPEYRSNFESKEKETQFKKYTKDGTDWLSERLRWLKGKGLDINQMYWYFQYTESLNNKDIIKQEYPCTPEEAFLMSGRPVFNIENIIKRISDLREKYKETPYKEGFFYFEWEDPETENKIINSSIKFIESKENNWIRLYKKPNKKTPYVIGGDTKGEGNDFYTATVLNNLTGNRIATLKMQTNYSKPYAHQMYCLGNFFNNALVGIEINFNTSPIEELQRLRYPKQYVRRKFDDYRKQLEPKYGWKTDRNTRPLIIDSYAELIQNRIYQINDIPTLEEALTFIYDNNGRPDALPGKHDDLLFSDMIANQIREQQSFKKIDEEHKRSTYTKDMMEDYKKSSGEERKLMIKEWGNPF